MKRIFILILILGLAISTTSYAEMTVKQYRTITSNEKGRDLIEDYVRGLGSGMLWASGFADKPVFCPPGKLALNTKNYVFIIDTQIEKRKNRKDLDDIPIAALLIAGLIETFPCK